MSRAYPDSPVFYRNLRQDYPAITRGEGCWLYDDQGRGYLDAAGGAFVASLGHGVREVAEAMAEQAARIGYVNGTAFTHEPAERLAELLCSLAPEGLDKVFFLGSGSEAVEAALKLARQYWMELGRPGKSKIVARTPGYHGNTLLALSASARGRCRKAFEPWLVDVTLIPAPYSYRCACGGREPLCPACSGEALGEALLREDPDTVAAFIAEPVGGSSTGASAPSAGHYRRIREICDRHGVLFIADEIAVGCGRTGTWSALEPYGAVPDILLLGKGLTGGYAPLSALLAPRRLVDPIAAGTGSFLHAQTFSHHPVSCAAGLASVKLMLRQGLIERSAAMGRRLLQKLSALRDIPEVGDVRGRGLLAAVELVSDPARKTPFPRALRLAERLVEEARRLGLVLWPNAGQADGENGDLVMLAPPYVIREAEIDEIVSRLRAALENTLKEHVPA